MSEPATKQDLDEAMGVLRGEMKATTAELRGEMKATTAELRGEMKATAAELRDEMKATTAELRGEMTAMETRMRGEMTAMETRMLHEIGSAIANGVNVMTEEFRRQFAVLDDKLGALAQRHDELRTDFDAHKADISLHAHRPAVPPKRTRRSPSR